MMTMMMMMVHVFQLDVLSDVVQAVAGRCEVYLDGGIRTGTDVFKALALGAKAVFVGRPVIHGLAYNVWIFRQGLQGHKQLEFTCTPTRLSMKGKNNSDRPISASDFYTVFHWKYRDKIPMSISNVER